MKKIGTLDDEEVNMENLGTVNGRKIKSIRVYQEGDYWRWEIVTVGGYLYVDGGNYLTKDAALQALDIAKD